MNEPLTQLSLSRRWRQQLHPQAVVGAILCREVDTARMCLLIRRIHPPYAGKWALVGGKWDFGETLSEAITREVREETGLVTEFVALREFVNERLFPQQPDESGAHFSIFACEVRNTEGEPCEQEEGAVAWFHESQLEDLWSRKEIVPIDYMILKHFLTAVSPFACFEAEIVADNMGSSTSELRRFERYA